jgi:hypothetical protein
VRSGLQNCRFFSVGLCVMYTITRLLTKIVFLLMRDTCGEVALIVSL